MIINEDNIQAELVKADGRDKARVREVLEKAKELCGLSLAETAVLAAVCDDELIQEIFTAARKVKDEIYGKRLVLFAPLYVSNLCTNGCLYCAFRVDNKDLKRRFLSQEEIKRETEVLINQGHKRLVLLAGEAYPQNDFNYILDSIATVYGVKNKNGEIRRVNVNLAPLDFNGFKLLKESSIGTYQLFQETYHRNTYRNVHVSGKKADYDWRITAFDRAICAGIDDVGLGVLFGLYDWRFEVLALLEHANYLQGKFGIGPHTISVPRLEPALNSFIAQNPPAPILDCDFYKIIAILRLAIPYTGIIMSTREIPEIRRKSFALGVSQISAGSRVDPGGYSHDDASCSSQFTMSDCRSLDEVVRDITSLGYIPSFCTACYRSGRTGEDFMCLAKPGVIKNMCTPNALITFAEYLLDYASSETKSTGNQLIEQELSNLSSGQRQVTEKILAQIRSGKRDLYV